MSKRIYEGLVGWLGGGPWMVLPDCPAPRHNTLSAAKGRYCMRRGRYSSGLPKCICPRGLEMRRMESVQRRDNKKALQEAARREELRVPTYLTNTRNQGVPDLSKGACRTDKGRRIIDAAGGKQANSAQVLAARFMCADCSAMVACGDWVTRDEKPAGSWGLMYAGMTPRERIRRSRGAQA